MAACCQVAAERWTEIMQMNILIYILEDTKITFESEGNAMLTIDVKGKWQALSNVQMTPRLIQQGKAVSQGIIPLNWDANFIAIQISECLGFQTIWLSVHIQNNFLASPIVVKILQMSRVDRVHRLRNIVPIGLHYTRIGIRIVYRTVGDIT